MDSIGERLPPIVETGERSLFAPVPMQPPRSRRRSAAASSKDEDELAEREAEEAHVLDDLA